MVITPFKVIQGHRFWYRSKAHVRLPIVININLTPVLHHLQVMADYMSNFRYGHESNVLAGVIPCEHPDKRYLFRN